MTQYDTFNIKFPNSKLNRNLMKSTYVETTDNTFQELPRFQDFLYRNSHNHECYKDMQSDSNQWPHLYGLAKTHKFETLQAITVANLKFQPIIDQTGTFTYNVARVISDYLRTLCKNGYSINGTQKFPRMLLQFHLYKMMKMYHMMLSHYLQIFL